MSIKNNHSAATNTSQEFSVAERLRQPFTGSKKYSNKVHVMT
ncbi:hypothetical protein [Piscirickettsia salmonis]|nr:hypothetical protein [Piscirickettsia salmonis]